MNKPKQVIKIKNVCFCLCFFLSITLSAQVNFTANDSLRSYKGTFRAGVNFDIYRGFSDEDQATLAAGNEQLGVQGVGIKALRPGFFEDFAEQFGYDIRLNTFKYYDSLGLKDNTMIIGFPSKDHRDPTFYCPNHQSTVFKNMDSPIWDGGKNGTPVNDTNYYALYLWKTVTLYKNYVKFWEVWNEPGFDFTGSKGWLPKGTPGNWWDNNPEPCDYKLRAPIFTYVRLLRISYEVIKSVDPSAYVVTSGLGYPSFLDAILRNTDNPDGGKLTPQYPLRGGAYFDGIGYHAYPHFDDALRRYNNQIQGFEYFRHSDAAAIDPERIKNQYEDVFKNYGYDGNRYPRKIYLITETNLPRKEFGEFIGSPEAQRNWITKAYVNCAKNDIWQMHIFKLAEETTYETATYEFDVMGLYKKLNYTNKTKPELNDIGIAYSTVSNILFGLSYDSVRTKTLNLPPSVGGGVFKDNTGVFTYVLWAKTTQDKNETASANYTFPTNFNIDSLLKRDWQFSKTKNISVISSKNIALTATPIFLTERWASASKYFICEGESVLFQDKSGSATRSWTGQTAPGLTYMESVPSFSKVFNKKGVYEAQLVARNATGVIIAQQIIRITVESKPTAAFNLDLQNPIVRVTSLASANATQITWDFGDGKTAFQPFVSKIFQKSGTFTVQLKAENYCGSTTANKQVTITAPSSPPSPITANQTVPTYNGHFRAGVNMRFVEGWTDEQIADIAAGNIEQKVKGAGARSLRTALPEYFTKFWGANVRVKTFQHFENVDLKDVVLTIGSPDSSHRDPNFYCFYKQSFLFKNSYLDIWDDGKDGTPVNDANYFARYVYDLVKLYKNEVRFWEIWDAPGWDFEGKNGWKPRNWQNNWWENNPDPCELGVFASVQHIIRLHRIAYEVIKREDPTAYILFSGAGFPSFLDAMLRNTDNPEDGSVTPQFPYKGGAYFDAVQYNVFPHLDGSLAGYDPSVGRIVYRRHTDAAIKSINNHKVEMDSVLARYGYDGRQMPKKQYLIGEINLPRKPLGDLGFGGDDVQKNFIIKSYVAAVKAGILQMNVKSITEESDFSAATDASQVMGLYQRINGRPHSATLTIQGIAFKTTSDILYGLKYDAQRTQSLNFPANIDGAAFKNTAGQYTYVLWAVTKDDKSELAMATFSFPTNLNIRQLYKREWNFSTMPTVTTTSPLSIALTGTPIFLSESPTLTSPPLASFKLNYQKSCPPLKVTLENLSENATEYLWTFEGGTPATSTERTPSVTFNKGGQFDIKLRVTNSQGTHTHIKLKAVETDIPPKADFQYSLDSGGFVVRFINKTTGSFTMIWNFGDGSPVNQTFMPMHRYRERKDYTVRLIAINECGRDTMIKKISLTTSTQDPSVTDLKLTVFPNPFLDNVNVGFNLNKKNIVTLELYDLNGSCLKTFFTHQELDSGSHLFDFPIPDLPKGMYLICLRTQHHVVYLKTIKM